MPISERVEARKKYMAMDADELRVEMAMKLDRIDNRLMDGDAVLKILEKQCPLLNDTHSPACKTKNNDNNNNTWSSKAKIVTAITVTTLSLIGVLLKFTGVV